MGLRDKDQEECKIICFSEPPVLTVRSSLQKEALHVQHRHDLLSAGKGGVPTALKEQQPEPCCQQLSTQGASQNMFTYIFYISCTNLNNTDIKVSPFCFTVPVRLELLKMLCIAHTPLERDPDTSCSSPSLFQLIPVKSR